MSKVFNLLFFLLTSYNYASQVEMKGRKVRVLIKSTQTQIFDSKNLIISSQIDHKKWKSTFLLNSSFSLKVCGTNICFQEKQQSKVFKSPLKLSSTQTIKISKNQHMGEIWVHNSKNKLLIIEHLGMEDYIRGVLPFEIGPINNRTLEAAKAQAVAARTYALNHVITPLSIHFDLYSDTRSQVFKGYISHSISDSAIWQTRGQSLWHGTKPAQTFFHSTAGTHLAAIHEVWGKEQIPYLISKTDLRPDGLAWDTPSPWTNWKRKIPFKQMKNNFKKYSKKYCPSLNNTSNIILSQILITKRFHGGRTAETILTTNEGDCLLLGEKTRWLFRNKKNQILPSSRFQVTRLKDHWNFEGSGFGHGIGMSQFGALERSRAGQHYQEILEAYYPKTKLMLDKKDILNNIQ